MRACVLLFFLHAHKRYAWKMETNEIYNIINTLCACMIVSVNECVELRARVHSSRFLAVTYNLKVAFEFTRQNTKLSSSD